MSNVAIVEQLDQAINVLLAGAESEEPVIDPELRELLAVATELRYLPDPGFKGRLRAELVDELVSGSAKPVYVMRQGEDENVLPSLFGARYGSYPMQRANFAASLMMHAAALALIAYSGLWISRNVLVKPPVNSIAVELSPYELPASPSISHGGGGGGDRDKFDASRGSLPRSAREQITPPVVVIRNANPKLTVEPRVVAPPNLPFPQMARLGDPLGAVMAPLSNGIGSGGGIGSGKGDGVGGGKGPGVGPGEGGGIGGGIFRVGGGVSAPRAIYAPDPDYSEEARKAKYQGTVVLWVVVGADGRAHDMRVERSLGMGLDEKAIRAVRTWRFEPALKDGHPVAVQINVEVNFRLY